MENPNHREPRELNGNRINWNQIFYFCQIALYGSIKEAATSLQLSASTLSEHLNELEKDLRITLFFREHRKLTLTPQGSRLFQHAKQMFEAGQRLIDVVSPVSLGCYPLSIGVVSGGSTWLCHSTISEFVSAFHPVSMKIVQAKHDELEKGLADARFDFGFSDRGSDRNDLVARPIFSSFLKFFVSPKLKEKSLIKLCASLPIIYVSGESSVRSYLDHLLENLEITPSAVITSEIPGLLYQICASGSGVGFFNEAAVKRFGLGVRELALPKGTLEIQDKLYALWTRDAENSEAVRRLKEVLSPTAKMAGQRK